MHKQQKPSHSANSPIIQPPLAHLKLTPCFDGGELQPQRKPLLRQPRASNTAIRNRTFLSAGSTFCCSADSVPASKRRGRAWTTSKLGPFHQTALFCITVQQTEINKSNALVHLPATQRKCSNTSSRNGNHSNCTTDKGEVVARLHGSHLRFA